MGGSKLKWTVQEEQALRFGVAKYGKGKWRAIQKDEEFGPLLANRSNIDLKDKWRNLNIKLPAKKQSECSGSQDYQEEEDPRHAVIDHVFKAIGYTSSADDEDSTARKRKREQEAESTHSGIERLAELVAEQMLATAEPVAISECKEEFKEQEQEQVHQQDDFDKHLQKRQRTASSASQRKGPNVEDMVIAAIASLHDSNGSALEEIYEWIEMHYSVDPIFRRTVACTLRRLSRQGRLEVLHYSDGCYRLAGIQHKGSDEEAVTLPLDKASRQAAEAAAVEAENAAALAAAQLRDQVFRSITACRQNVVPSVCLQHQIAANGTVGGL